jgi:asparagine synthase (glutamine-hydrolysing)
MCGIAGVVGTSDRLYLEELISVLHHRGPNGTGYASFGSAQVGATRLSIIDPGAGTDLIGNETGSIWIAFNGEIYNHRPLRADLQRKGHVFKTNTDTEVVVHLYEEFGEKCVDYLHGMFAFAIVEHQQVFLARDRLGIKPLYYTTVPGASLFVFASEIKALLQCPEVEACIDLQAFADFVVLSHPVGSDTFLRGVKSLRPGHTMKVAFGPNGLVPGMPVSYHSTSFHRDSDMSIDYAQEAFEDALKSATASHLAADVPVALTLSGGIDSTLLALLASEIKEGPLSTFTIVDQALHPDAGQAASIAAHIQSDHHEVVLGFAEYLEAITGFIAAEESPSRLYGLPYYVLSRHVSQSASVVLHGEGADELFGGYLDYLDPSHALQYAARRLPLIRRLGMNPSNRLQSILESMAIGSSEDEALQSTFALNLAEPLERHHLDPVDKCSMAFGIETRVPYLDDAVVELVCGFPLQFLVRRDLGVRKYLLRRLCLQRYGHSLMDIVLRGKLGLPSAAGALVGRFDSLCHKVLPENYLLRHELGYCFERKRDLLIFEMFEDIFLRNRGRAQDTGGVLDFMQSRSALSTAEFRSTLSSATARS